MVLALASLIRLRGLKADGVVVGECSSAALWLFAGCHKRLVTPFSVCLFHPMRWESEKRVTSVEAVSWARHFQQLEKEMDDLRLSVEKLRLELEDLHKQGDKREKDLDDSRLEAAKRQKDLDETRLQVEKLRLELEGLQKQRDKDYKAAMDKIPEKKANDPWGNVRDAGSPPAKKP